MVFGLSDLSSCLIAGAGPGGLAPLFAAAYDGRLRELLDSGVTIVEQTASVGAGELGRYAISSDSAAEAFLDVIMRTTEPSLAALRNHPLATSIGALAGQSIPLQQAAAFLALIGETICELVENSARGRVLRQHRVLFVRRVGPDTWNTRVRCELTGIERELLSKSIIVATGASQPLRRLYKENVAGAPLLPLYENKLMQTGEVLATGGLSALQKRLQTVRHPKVAIVGGSASAGAAATSVLYHSGLDLTEGAVTLMHRRPLRIFYPTAEAARAEGYTEFGPEDICPLSGRVFRLAGFRLESRELIMRARGIAGRPPEPRLRLFHLQESGHVEARQLLDDADVIIAGLGYRPRALPVYGQDNLPVPLMAETDAMRPMVNDDCCVLNAQGTPVSGIYGIGLASGFVPRGSLGGEPSFQGQANSLWLWQHEQGMKVLDGVMRSEEKKSTAFNALHRNKSSLAEPAMNIRSVAASTGR